MEQKENLIDILRILLRWKKPILYTCLGIGGLTALISLLLPNYYESTTIFYAASMDQAKPEQIFGTSTNNTSFYGNDHDNDRFYQVLKTKRDAIELSVEDTDPEQAAAIVNAARDKVDELYVKIIRGQLTTLEQSLIKNIDDKETSLQVVNDSLLAAKTRYGIYDAENQGEVFAQQLLRVESKLSRESAKLETFGRLRSVPRDTISFLKAAIAGYKKELQLLEKKQILFNKGLSDVTILERQQKELANRLSYQKVQLNQLVTASETSLSGINLIEAGTVPVMKSRPKRSIIVVSAVLMAFLFSVIGILLFDAYKEVDWKALWVGDK